MWEQMMDFLKSFFSYPGLKWELLLVAIGLGPVAGANPVGPGGTGTNTGAA
ncbi:MAG: hypothetical protein ABR958_02530 [Dehalococcoidales bacterium]|jgi:hypothetical protein